MSCSTASTGMKHTAVHADGGVLLCIPAAYSTTFPPLGTAALTGFLTQRGIAVRQHDSNIAFRSFARRQRLFPVKQAASRMRYEFEYYPGTSFVFTEELLSGDAPRDYITDPRRNSFIGFFYQDLYRQLRPLRKRPMLVGLSITAPSQAICAFTFGFLVKKEFPGIHVVIGGQWCGLFAGQLSRRKDFAAFFDSFVAGEGETPLLRLVDELRSGKPRYARVPNLFHPCTRGFSAPAGNVQETMDSLPAPDFDGLPLASYSGGRAVTYETARGCYWGKCAFCVDLPQPQPCYREKDPRRAADEIAALARRYRPGLLVISNPAFAPGQMQALCRLLIRRKITLPWWCWCRFDPAFTPGIFRLAKKAGCVSMGFGLESFNQEILDRVRKGTRLPVISRIIRQAHAAGLDIFLQAIIGLPTERPEQSLNTIGFLLNMRRYVKKVMFNGYYLTPGNPVFSDPGAFHLRVKRSPVRPFRFFHDFDHCDTGFTDERKRKLIMLYDRLAQR